MLIDEMASKVRSMSGCDLTDPVQSNSLIVSPWSSPCVSSLNLCISSLIPTDSTDWVFLSKI